MVNRKDRVRKSYIQLIIAPEREENGTEAIF